MGIVRAVWTIRVADPRRRRTAPLRALGLEHGDRVRLWASALGDPNDLGLDAAFAALFLALAKPYLHERRAVAAALIAAAITLVLIPIAPAGVPLVAASAACLLGLRR